MLTAFAAEHDRPNILFAIADDASYPHMSAYGVDWVETPSFDRVAKEGLLFNHAYTPNAKCSPSRACILTGRNSWQLKEAANHVPHFPSEFKTYAEALAENGYYVGKTGKGWAPGIAVDAQGMKRQLAGKPFDALKTKPPASHISNNNYSANFVQFLESKPIDQPFCFWYGALEPHRAYEYGVGARLGGKKVGDIDNVPAFWPDNEIVRNDMLDYAFEIEYFDQHLGHMLMTLEDRDLLENTLVVVTSDNGMPFPRVKAQEYEMSNHLPLAIMWKKGIQRPGRVIDDYVSFIDIAPTFLKAAHLAWSDSGMATSPGRDLFDIFNSRLSGRVNPQRDHVLIGKERHDIGRPGDVGYPIRGIVKEGMLFLQNFEPSRWPAGNPETGYLAVDGSPTKTAILKGKRDGSAPQFWDWAFGFRDSEELFDLEADPACMNNLAAEKDLKTIKASLKNQLMSELRNQNDPRTLGRGEVFDNYPFADKRTKDFHRRFTAGEKIRAGWVNPTDFEKAP